MLSFFSKRFHFESRNRDRLKFEKEVDPRLWPKSWTTVEYKEYFRLPKISLPLLADLHADLSEMIVGRKARRDFDINRSLSTQELSTLLKYSAGETTHLDKERMRRAYPSAGARYPLEVYPIIFRPIENIKAGLYHYNPHEHSLSTLSEREFSDSDIDSLFFPNEVLLPHMAQVGLVVTAVFDRNQRKYAERGYRLILLEAGHMGQNIYLVSEALKIKCVGVSATNDESLEKFIDIDGLRESVVYGFLLGK